MEKPTSKIGFLGHYGLVKTFVDELGITSTIDEMIHKPKRKISVGNDVSVMILNGLGFTSQALYLTPTFCKNLPVEILFGKDVKPEDFNDDSLGTAPEAWASSKSKICDQPRKHGRAANRRFATSPGSMGEQQIEDLRPALDAWASSKSKICDQL